MMTTMPLSTESGFAAVTFPALNADGQGKTDAVAYANGHTAGYTAGLRKAAAETEARRQDMEAEHAAVLRHTQARADRAVEQLAAAVAALHAAALPSAAAVQETLLAASLELAENIIGVELGDGDHSARAALTRALADAPAHGTVTVRMHPADLSVLGDLADVAGAALVADASVERGGAVADYDHGHLDATLTAALARTRQALFGVVGS
jgi:flagellar assembly protein FliH